MAQIEVSTVIEKIQNGFDFDFGKYITEGFEIFKKEWLLFSLYGFISTLIIFFSFLTIIGPFLLMFPIFLGYSVAAEKVERGEKLEFKDFFGAFKNFGQYFVLSLIYVGTFIILYIPIIMFFVFIDGFSDNGNLSNAGPVLGVLMMVYYLFFYVAIYLFQGSVLFAPYLIHYGNYSAVNALKTSIKLFRKKFLMILLFVFVVGMIGGIGYMACLIGIFASMAASMLMQYAMVKDILMKSSFSEIDQIGNAGI